MLFIVRNLLAKTVTCFCVTLALFFLSQLEHTWLQESWAGPSIKTGSVQVPSLRVGEERDPLPSNPWGDKGGCCCEAAAGGNSEISGMTHCALSRQENPAFPDSASPGPFVSRSFDFNNRLDGGPRTSAKGPPPPLFLINLSFLC